VIYKVRTIIDYPELRV